MPGVPPDTANIVKRVFKGIFKRGKKNKQDGAETASSSAPPQQDQAPAAAGQSPPPQIDTKAPQLPPIGNASPLQGAAESPKAVPPTHPLSTGENSTPQEAVPQNKDADPAPGPPLGPVTAAPVVPSANDTVKEPEKLAARSGDVSPPVSTADAADAPKSGAVSAISSEQPKTDGAADPAPAEVAKVEEIKPTEPATQAPTTDANTTAITDTTETSEPAPSATKEIIPPQTNGATTNDSTSSPIADTASAPATDSTTTDSKPAPSGEKMPSVEEPPPIKTVRAAPGMSATSGPLEDFPEGGDAKYQ